MLPEISYTESAGRARPAVYEDTRAAGAGAEGAGASILDQIRQKLPQNIENLDREECIARKDCCKSVWCPVCYRRFHLKRHYERMSEIPWDECRFITLTLDREKTGGGADAFLWVREHKPVGRFIVKLGRLGVDVKDWCGQLEFHRDGTPHFHLLVRTKAGPSGMIGNERMMKAWPYGIVREEYFKTEKDYNNVVGYFGQSGYFHKGKEHQTRLPDYASSEYFKGKRIIRFFSARKGEREKDGTKPRRETSDEEKQIGNITAKRIEDCGKETIIFYDTTNEGGFPELNYKYLCKVDIPYCVFRVAFPGHYIQGCGYSFYLSGQPPEECPY